ncbi:MAG: inositol monophosphatase [Bacteroidetes bacterium]|nr:inositol monophosphatase [Bacteroidota bacterium]
MQKLVTEVRQIANKVGEFARNERLNFKRSDVQFKSANKHDLVSYVDQHCELQLVEALQKLEPNAGIIAEEYHSDYKEGLNWIIDPIDGTTNFVHDIPYYAISIALAQDQEMLLGVVLEIPTGNCFHTFKGQKSYLNDDEIRVSETATLKQALLSTGFSVKSHDKLEQNLELLHYWISNSRGIRRLGSAALDLCYLAKGSFDAFYETGLKAWDVAAGSLIVQNAGGRISTFSGGKNFVFGNEILASNPHLFDELSEIYLQKG